MITEQERKYIKGHLPRSGRADIARVFKVTYQCVHQVLSGRRKNRPIVDAAIELAKSAEEKAKRRREFLKNI